ncbi:MAG TPA: PEP-CTERM sorting domain-containing protein [Pirellulaceae bacterium]|nr:PEP-CTERM sorting domain-containing protein [Pirellulaceae bacterium]HMO93709.1 PEP-CTERM sorting domain-containing protein [Pirellulaceae bacterium]HMP69788.1 PEP-CTERM sorting domain-containing protein [Pirellulaceae bacterium]
MRKSFSQLSLSIVAIAAFGLMVSVSAEAQVTNWNNPRGNDGGSSTGGSTRSPGSALLDQISAWQGSHQSTPAPNPIPELLTNGSASQIFEPANAAFHVFALDDFFYNGTDLLTRFDFAGFRNSGTPWDAAITGFRIAIFDDPANVGGTTFSNALYDQTFATNGYSYGEPSGIQGLANSGYFEFNLGGVQLAGGAGTRWIGVAPIMDFAGNGQTFIYQSNYLGGSPNGFNGLLANPGGGFGQGAVIPLNANLAYRLWGTPIPEPSGALLLGMLAVGFLGVRRKK